MRIDIHVRMNMHAHIPHASQSMMTGPLVPQLPVSLSWTLDNRTNYGYRICVEWRVSQSRPAKRLCNSYDCRYSAGSRQAKLHTNGSDTYDFMPTEPRFFTMRFAMFYFWLFCGSGSHMIHASCFLEPKPRIGQRHLVRH